MGNARFSLKVPGETAQAVVVLGHGGFADTQVFCIDRCVQQPQKTLSCGYW